MQFLHPPVTLSPHVPNIIVNTLYIFVNSIDQYLDMYWYTYEGAVKTQAAAHFIFLRM
jgi:hypothetical protein